MSTAKSLAEHWYRLFPAKAVTTAMLNRLLAAYAEPHRYYHNLNHLSFLLQGFVSGGGFRG